MSKAIVAVVAGVIAAAATGAAGWQAPDRDHSIRLCTAAAQRIQDESRVLRNGVTAGASRRTLVRERVLIANYIHDLEEAEGEWLATLEDAQRIRLHLAIVALSDDRQELEKHLSELTTALGAPELNARRVQEIARSIANHAESWARNVRRATAQDGSPGR